MTFPLVAVVVAVGFSGAFYTFLVVAIARRAKKPSCRICVFWHDCCLSAQLGHPGPTLERCLANKSRP
jgi:hypothetical protein